MHSLLNRIHTSVELHSGAMLTVSVSLCHLPRSYNLLLKLPWRIHKERMEMSTEKIRFIRLYTSRYSFECPWKRWLHSWSSSLGLRTELHICRRDYIQLHLCRFNCSCWLGFDLDPKCRIGCLIGFTLFWFTGYLHSNVFFSHYSWNLGGKTDSKRGTNCWTRGRIVGLRCNCSNNCLCRLQKKNK